MTLLGSFALTGDLFAGVTVGTVVAGVVTPLVVGGVAWWSWRYAKRGVNRGQWRLERAGLRLRSVVLPMGSRREIVKMRLALHDNLAQTQRVLRQPVARDAVPGSTRDLLPPLERLAAGLDGQLRLWQSEPDAALVLDALPELRERCRTLIGQALAVRTSALQALHDTDPLARGAAEEHLRSRVEGLNSQPPAMPQLRAPSGRTQATPPTVMGTHHHP